MFKSKTTAALLMVLAIGATTASSASASWIIAGTKMGAGSKAALASTAKVSTPLTLKIAGSKTVKAQCGGTVLHAEAPELIGPTEITAKSLTFEGCETTEPTKCELEGTTIKTAALKGFVTTGPSKSAGRMLLLPQTKTLVAELPFKATDTCGFAGKEPLLGDVNLGAPALQTEATLQMVEGLGAVENDGLEVNSDAAQLEGGKTLLQLASGAKYKFAGDFEIASSRQAITFNEETTFTVTNLANVEATVKSITDTENAAGTFEWNGASKNLCIKPYAAGATCTFKAKYVELAMIGRFNVLTFTVEDENTEKSTAGVVGA